MQRPESIRIALNDLHVTYVKRLLESCYRLTPRRELLPDIAVIVRSGNRSHDGGVVEFLRLIQVMASGIARRVKMPDVGNVVAEGANHVAFLLLHP